MKNLAGIDEESENYKFGLSVGVLVACKKVLAKLNDRTAPLPKRISDVKQFCNNPYKLISDIKDNTKGE